jgi:hypothetical protein
MAQQNEQIRKMLGMTTTTEEPPSASSLKHRTTKLNPIDRSAKNDMAFT